MSEVSDFQEKSLSIQADVKIDAEFPHTDGTRIPVSDEQLLARTVSSLPTASALLTHSASSGRSGYVELVFSDDRQERVFNAVFIKGTGAPEIARPPAHKFPMSTKWQMSGELFGVSTRADQVFDAENSLKMNGLGIITRIPIKGFYLQTLELDGLGQSVEELRRQGKIAERMEPHLSLWATECAFRLHDLVTVLSRGNREQVGAFMGKLLQYASNSKSEFFPWYERYKKETPRETLVELSSPNAILAYLEILADRLGGQFKRARAIGFQHGNLHYQNVGLTGEFVDNSRAVFGIAAPDRRASASESDYGQLRDGIYFLAKSLSKYSAKEVSVQEVLQVFDSRCL